MKNYKQLLGQLMFLCIMVSAPACAEDRVIKADLAILNGTVIDATGNSRYASNIAVREGRIIYVGLEKQISAHEQIDAKGLIITPGFIDGHSHTGEHINYIDKRLNENVLAQGVTTIVFGADGMFSPTEIDGYLDKFTLQGIGTNVGFYVGHNGIRREVMGEDQRREPTTAELVAMKQRVVQGMKMGAVGLSTGLMYEPGLYSRTDEVIYLARAVADFGGIYDSHVRDPINALFRSDQEVIEIGRAAGVAAKIAHLKAPCLKNSGETARIIELIREQRKTGFNLVSDQYPYDGAKTDFLADILILPQSMAEKKINLKTALSDPQLNAEIQQLSEHGFNDGFAWLKVAGYSCIRITNSKDYPGLVGKYLSQLAEQEGRTGFEVVTSLLLNARHNIRVTMGGIEEDDVRHLLVQPWNMIISDGSYVTEDSSPKQHPRSTGTFVRVLGHYVRELGLLSLEDAVGKMTSKPADFLGFRNRGRILVGAVADITVFDPQLVADRSTWDEPLLFPVGIRYVVVNGKLAWRKGEATSVAAGTIVRREKPTPAYLY